MEKFDLYDSKRNNTHKTIVRGEELPKDCFYYAVSVCIFNSKGEMLIQKRAETKKYLAGLWDFSVAGCLSSGEDSQMAIQREVKEELGIDIDFSNKRPMITYSFEKGYNDIYIIHQDVDLNKCVIQKEELSEIKYASKEEIENLIAEDKFVSYYSSVINFIFEMKDNKNLFSKF